MEILKTRGIVKEGQILIKNPSHNLSNDTEVEVILVIQGETKKEEFDQARQEMQKAFQEAGINTREQVLELIQEVKKELFAERYQ